MSGRIAIVELPDDVASKPIYALSRTEALQALGNSRRIFEAVVTAGWLKPVLTTPVRYDTGDVAHCWQRIRNGERPMDSAGNQLLD